MELPCGPQSYTADSVQKVEHSMDQGTKTFMTVFAV